MTAEHRSTIRMWFPWVLLAAVGAFMVWRLGSAAWELESRTGVPPRGVGVDDVPMLATNLERSNFDAWARHILPDPDELAFERIDWLPSFGEGVAAAAAAHRPLLVWGMNGHPLGCT